MNTVPTNTPTTPAPTIELVGFECGLHMGPPVVHIRTGSELSGELFRTALQHIDEFQEPGRTLLLDLQAALDRVAEVDPASRLIFRPAAAHL